MPGLLSTTVMCAALVCAASSSQAAAQAEVQAAPHVEADAMEVALEAPVKDTESTGPSEVSLVEFDGAWQFLKTSRRLRIWRPEVEFTLNIDAEGEPTDCMIENRFRQNYINQKLCDVLMKHHTFEPARDADNAAVAGVYHAKLRYSELRKEFD